MGGIGVLTFAHGAGGGGGSFKTKVRRSPPWQSKTRPDMVLQIITTKRHYKRSSGCCFARYAKNGAERGRRGTAGQELRVVCANERVLFTLLKFKSNLLSPSLVGWHGRTRHEPSWRRLLCRRRSRCARRKRLVDAPRDGQRRWRRRCWVSASQSLK